MEEGGRMTVEPRYKTRNIDGEELSEEEKDYLEKSSLEVENFDKRNWKSAESRDEWRDILQRASRGMMEAEWRSVMDEKTDRKAAIIHVANRNREKWLERLSEKDLVFREIRYTEPYNGGFSHKFFPTDKSDPERITYSVVARNEDIADKMKEAELEMDGEEKHDTVGKLLGFPKCCRKHFYQRFVEDSIRDPMYEITCNTEGVEKIEGDPEKLKVENPEPLINSMWRYFGWRFITHHPCSWKCEKSVAIAENRKRIMKENGYKEAAEKLEEWLNLPFTWTVKNGLMHIKNKHFIGSARSSNYWSKKKVIWKKKHRPGGSIV